MKPTRLGALTALLLVSAGLLSAQMPTEMPLSPLPASVEVRSVAAPPLRLAERPGAQVAYLLPAWQVAPLELEEIALWNRMGKTPAKNGFTRMLPQAVEVRLGPGMAVRSNAPGVLEEGAAQRAGDGAVVWGAEVRLEDSWRLRLRLSEVSLPPGTQMWVYNEEGETVGPFGLELMDPEGGLWTPSVAGPAARLELRIPALETHEGVAPGFLLDRALELVGPGNGGPALAARAGECLVDGRCIGAGTFPVIDGVRRAIAGLFYVQGGGGFVCTGGLLNNQSPLEPLLLTAHHCIGTQAVAASLEAFWDFFTATCNGAAPALGSLPRSLGSTLLATGAMGTSTDFTLLRLDSFPDLLRWLLGWIAAPEAAGHNTVVHRLHNPVHPGTGEWLAQRYSRNRVDITAPTCGGVPRPDFLYSIFQSGHGIGGSFGGSSGSPAMNAAGQVIGQLVGGCGPDNPQDGCDYRNSEVDGAFSRTFPTIAAFLLPTPEPCVSGPTTLCLHGNRFRVEIVWLQNHMPTNANVAQGVGTSQSGLFYFLDPTNWEFLVKVLNACALNNHYWVFFAATTNVGFTVTVTDTLTGEVRQYFNPAGQPADAITDTQAFATCP